MVIGAHRFTPPSGISATSAPTPESRPYIPAPPVAPLLTNYTADQKIEMLTEQVMQMVHMLSYMRVRLDELEHNLNLQISHAKADTIDKVVQAIATARP